jgi:hypothetical protein
MTLRQKISVFEVLSWMKEHQFSVNTTLDEIAAHFGVDQDQMRKLMQALQRYECVKRGGRANAEWSITEHGLVRLAEGRFSPSGAFLSAYDQSIKPSANSTIPAPAPTTSDASETSDSQALDSEDASPTSRSTSWQWPSPGLTP